MKQFGRALLALVLALLIAAGDAAVFGRAAAAGGDDSAPAGRWEESASLTARKKRTASPAPAGTATPAPLSGEMTPTPVPEGPIIDPQSIADYLFAHDMRLPENFITKKEARALGWDSSYNYLSDVAPGMSIGGDYFGNYEEKLPAGKGISYHEADCWYTKGRRNAFRVVYSTEGRVWYTEDHYNTFTELFPTGTVPAETAPAGTEIR